MADTDLKLKAIDALVHIHTAIKNVQRHPSVDPAITNSIETLYLHLVEILKQDAPQVFAELEKKSLLREKLSNQQEDETIHISALPDILLGLGIKNISFDKDLEKEELHIFINLLAKKPKTVHDEVGLPKLILENETAQIVPDNKVSVTMEKDQVIVSDRDIAESQISESIVEMQTVFTRLNAMHGSIESLPSEEKRDMIKRLSVRTAEWIEMETAVTSAYKKICQSLQTLLQDFITYGFFAEANPIIDVFSKINTGALKKDYEVRKVSLEILRNLASESNINILLKEFNTNEKHESIEAFQILNGFGDIIMNKLLNIVRNASDSKERISIIHIIEEMGHRAIPAIIASITMNAPWYYLRNMAYILGRIGNETNADILRVLLMHKDKRVHKEALKSIGQIGGNKKGPLLLSFLPQAEGELRVNVIEMLGKIRYTEAVPGLLDMLKNKSLIAKDEQISLQEKICNALGTIGSPEAIKILSEIAESKSILGIGSYPKEVKSAAERALANIKRKQE
ncbi:MAG: HEAT repeat domain-containing protein [Smithella sp.]|jgi:HEAT repeat protein